MTPTETVRTIAMQHLDRLIFAPYRWAGDDPLSGWDCSGLVVEMLQAVGWMARKSDLTAQGIAEFCQSKRLPEVGLSELAPGCLLFYRRGGQRIVHVEVVRHVIVDGQRRKVLVIGAMSGDSSVTSDDVAAAKNAFVALREADYSFDFANDPFAELLNMRG